MKKKYEKNYCVYCRSGDFLYIDRHCGISNDGEQADDLLPGVRGGDLSGAAHSL